MTGVVEIKSLQVPGERTQSAERAKERRRDKCFPFKLIPLRPSRFPSQDSQKSDKNLALWIWWETGRGEGWEERLFRGGRAAQKEQRGTARGDQGETRRVGSSSEGASRRRRRVPAKNQSSEDRHYQLSKPMLHVWSCAQPINRGCIFIMLGSWQPEILASSELAWDQTLDEAGVVIRSMLGPQRNTRYQSNPETPQRARLTTDLPESPTQTPKCAQ